MYVATGRDGQKVEQRVIAMAHEQEKHEQQKVDRRGFVADGIRVLGALGLGGAAALLIARKGKTEEYVWQIDPDKCIACDNCQTHCVLDVSASKVVQCFALCGYCDVCTGYFPTKDFVLETGAENQLCPTGAITRKFIEEKGGERFFEYTIDEALCIGCAKCVLGCRLMNGSLYMQVRHDRCLNCNECAIAIACPPQAFRRVPVSDPNLLRKAAHEAVAAQRRKHPQQPAKALGAGPTIPPPSARGGATDPAGHAEKRQDA
jgi:Na+-translocating ferredoxin:NAD+ oxidoreductase subunit B